MYKLLDAGRVIIFEHSKLRKDIAIFGQWLDVLIQDFFSAWINNKLFNTFGPWNYFVVCDRYRCWKELIIESVLLEISKGKQENLVEMINLFTFCKTLEIFDLFFDELLLVIKIVHSFLMGSIFWNYSMVLVLRNWPTTLKSTGPDLSSVEWLKLKASIDKMDIFSGRLDSLNLPMSIWGVASSLYYSIFFLLNRLQKPISIITFHVTNLFASIFIYY